MNYLPNSPLNHSILTILIISNIFYLLLFSPVFSNFSYCIYRHYNLILTSNSPFKNLQLHQFLLKSSAIEKTDHIQSILLPIFFSYFFLFFLLSYTDHSHPSCAIFCLVVIKIFRNFTKFLQITRF